MDAYLYSEDELDKIVILDKIRSRLLTQKEAGILLGLSDRQIRRLLKRTESEGAPGIKPKPKAPKPSFSLEVKATIVSLVKNKYYDFGPTLASEKLESLEGIKINRESLRQIMIENNLWKGRSRKQARIHQSRTRRSRFGELIQIDGSDHDWFEGRADKCCLLVFIDDATSKLVGLRFEESETTLGYMRLAESYLQQYGRPIAFYNDKHSIFITTREQNVDGLLKPTQFHRALNSLSIEMICAYSSQAKGRVERANKTLQDRLIKEMRLRNISSIEEANAFMPEFILDYNARFSCEPASTEDAHRVLRQTPEALKQILSVHVTRKLNKNLEFSMDTKKYQITTQGKGYRLRNTIVTVCKYLDGRQEVFAGEQNLGFKIYQEKRIQPQVVDTKELNLTVDKIIAKAACGNMISLAA